MSILNGEERWESFVLWAKSEGLKADGLVASDFPDTGRGLKALRDFNIGDIILEVPGNIIITPDSILEKACNPSNVKLSAHQSIALFVALERRNLGRWKKYMDVLPQEFDTMPVLFSEKTMQWFPSYFQGEIARQRKKIKMDWKQAQDFVRTSGCNMPLFEDFLWGWLCVNTRCVYLDGHPLLQNPIGMAPFFDMLNHNHTAKIESEYDAKNDCFRIKTLTPYAQGDQVFISYGAHDNAYIFLEYGYLPFDYNPYDSINVDELFLNLRFEGEQDFRQKLEILKAEGYLGDFTLRLDQVSYRLLVALRLRAMLRGEKEALWRDMLMGRRDIISVENEAKTKTYLREMCYELVKQADHVLASMGAISPWTARLEMIKRLWLEHKNVAEKVMKMKQL
ncbi:uncharacterized protein VTP21DRAFT_7078 [Calcarisporiella thermophila]|uniref:uncharacterized protein n=1 Tax=Calcarisporiella thermophila TaxID=911321 RepID=UPI003742F47D